jgi:hypothetical protein
MGRYVEYVYCTVHITVYAYDAVDFPVGDNCLETSMVSTGLIVQ